MFEASAVDRVRPVAGLKLHASSKSTCGMESLGTAAMRTLYACRRLRLSSCHWSTERTPLKHKTWHIFMQSAGSMSWHHHQQFHSKAREWQLLCLAVYAGTSVSPAMMPYSNTEYIFNTHQLTALREKRKHIILKQLPRTVGLSSEIIS